VNEANLVEPPSSHEQDELPVIPTSSSARRGLGIQDHPVADVVDNEWVVMRSDGTNESPVFHAVESGGGSLERRAGRADS